MKFLGIDTSSVRASVAIVDNGRVLSETCHRPQTPNALGKVGSRNNHAEILISLIESSLKAVGLSLGDILGYSVAIGPGSFTGLRIGLSTAKGLTYGSGTPIFGVSTLHAYAARVQGFSGIICAILDAQKKEVYAAVFRLREGSLERLNEDAVMSFETLTQQLYGLPAPEPILVTGSGVAQYGEALAKSLGNRVCLSDDTTMPTVAAAVALLGEAQSACGATSIPVSMTPRYLRSPEAEVIAQKIPRNVLNLRG